MLKFASRASQRSGNHCGTNRLTSPNTISEGSLTPAVPPLLDPRALASLSRVELVAKQVMDGYVQGLHRSQHIGYALDFAQHRQYVPGDDVKRLDWRLYAKADKFYVKQYEVTTNLRAHLVLDASGSMAYQGTRDALSKFRYGQFMTACLAYLVLHQQDAAGLVTFDKTVRTVLPARSNRQHLSAIIDALDKTTAGGEGSLAATLHSVAEQITTRGLIVVISDLFDDADRLIEALHHFRHKRHEVALLHTMARDELDFPFRNVSEFASLETSGQRVRLDPAYMRRTYLENLAAHRRAIEVACGQMNISYQLMNTSESFAPALAAYLARRAGGR
jgi:uncharacterized protein (DUF58 family)